MKFKFKIPVMLIASLPALAQTGEPRDIFFKSTAARPAIKFNVQLERKGERKMVPATYAFQSGDKMKFRFELNRAAYIYVLLHSVAADWATADRYAGTRGIEVFREEDRRARVEDSYQLLFPTAESGTNNLVPAHTVKSMPYADGLYFRMDQKPGIEKLFLVVSAQPLDFSAYFDMRTGKMRPAAKAALKAAVSIREIPDENALEQLTRKLLEYGGNAQVDSAKGIDVVDSYAAAANPGKPMLVPVDLRHLPAR